MQELLIAGTIIGGIVGSIAWGWFSWKKELVKIKQINARGNQKRRTLKMEKELEKEKQKSGTPLKTSPQLESILNNVLQNYDEDEEEPSGIEGIIGQALQNPAVAKMAQGFLSGVNKRNENDINDGF